MGCRLERATAGVTEWPWWRLSQRLLASNATGGDCASHNPVCGRICAGRKMIADRRHATSRLRGCGGLSWAASGPSDPAAGERIAARCSSRPKPRRTCPREGLGWSPTKFKPLAARADTAVRKRKPTVQRHDHVPDDASARRNGPGLEEGIAGIEPHERVGLDARLARPHDAIGCAGDALSCEARSPLAPRSELSSPVAATPVGSQNRIRREVTSFTGECRCGVNAMSKRGSRIPGYEECGQMRAAVSSGTSLERPAARCAQSSSFANSVAEGNLIRGSFYAAPRHA